VTPPRRQASRPGLRGGFVPLYPETFQLLGHLSPGVVCTLIRLLVEADYRTGVVRSSMRSLAERWGLRYATLQDHLRRLVDGREILILSPLNQHGRAEIRVLRYFALTGRVADPEAGSAGGAESGSLQRLADTDGVTEGDPQTGSTQGSLPGAMRTVEVQDDEDVSTYGEGSSQNREAHPIPPSWKGTGSYERTISKRLREIERNEGATEEERGEVARRARALLDERGIKPSADVIGRELQAVRQEQAAADKRHRRETEAAKRYGQDAAERTAWREAAAMLDRFTQSQAEYPRSCQECAGETLPGLTHCWRCWSALPEEEKKRLRVEQGACLAAAERSVFGGTREEWVAAKVAEQPERGELLTEVTEVPWLQHEQRRGSAYVGEAAR
jgi:hypothetical protein